jgi:hypothetical protein
MVKRQIIKLIETAKKNKSICATIVFYLVIAFLQIHWGLPNNAHPFAYHMDEWAQAHSLRTTFRNGTPHIHGGGNGTVFFYIVSGVLLVPFVLTGFANPFAIKSSLDFYDLQHALFVALRFQSYLYAVGSIVLISYITWRYFKINKFLAALLLTVNPLFLVLTEYYRYDTPVVFWILLSLIFSFRYLKSPTIKNFFIAIIIATLTITIKVSALPLLFTNLSLLYFTSPKTKKHSKVKLLLYGFFVFAAVFLITGIPDIMISYKQFLNWFNYSAFSVAADSNKNAQLGMPYWAYFMRYVYPASFGHAAYVLFILCIISFVWQLRFSIVKLVTGLFKRPMKNIPQPVLNQLFLLFTFFVVVLSIVPLTLGGKGNRLLVILPFMGLITSIIVEKLLSTLDDKKRTLVSIALIAIMGFQTLESLSWVTTKLYPDPREVSSAWISKNIPAGSEVGIENIPIFQYIPDIILKDFYTKQYMPKYQTVYNYTIIDGKTKKFPPYVVITNEKVSTKYLIKSDKKEIVANLVKQQYIVLNTFTPNLKYFEYFNNPDVFYNATILPTPDSITIYYKNAH